MSNYRYFHKFLSLGVLLNLGIVVILSGATFYFTKIIKEHAQSQAIFEAETKAKIILDKNLAIHTYFSKKLKPKVFEMSDKVNGARYFEPSWMSSTYAIREIEEIFKSYNLEDYYYKESAVNARSPKYEADDFEKAFIEELKSNPKLQYRSLVRQIEGQAFYVTIRRGESLEESCLRCHGTPENAPQQLVERYGPDRSFNRMGNETISAISIRVPLSTSYMKAEKFSRDLIRVFIIVILIVLLLQFMLFRLVIHKPLKAITDKADIISNDNSKIGEEIPLPISYELKVVTQAFNIMSKKLREEFNSLEENVQIRTSELQASNHELKDALSEIKTLRGIIPICSYCKKIRDDKGAWEIIEAYICSHSEAKISHGICPECYEKEIESMNKEGI